MKIKIPPFKDLIIYEDENFFLINKPPFISSLEDRVEPNNILKMARIYLPEAQLCHRLDKETSGVLVAAKNNQAYKHMAALFEQRKVKKTYHAIADGIHEFRKEVIMEPISIMVKGVVHIDRRSGKPSSTIVTTLKAYRNHSLMLCEPITGRMHQIRVHLSSVGAPIAGDEQYGGKPFYLSSIKRKYKLGKFEEEKPLIRRVALHAQSIEFNLMDGKVLNISAPYPKDFQALINQLDKNP